MRTFVVMVMLLGCSDATQPSNDASTDALSDVAKVEDSAVDASMDVVTNDAPLATDGSPSQGACAACTANDCLPELEACGGSQTCTNDLVTFNNCLTADGADCGTSFAAGGSAEASLWACLESKCTNVCGTE